MPWEAGKGCKAGPGRGIGRGEQAPGIGGGERGSGSGSKNRVLSGEPRRLLPDLFHCCLPAGAAEPAAWGQGAHSGPSGVGGT